MPFIYALSDPSTMEIRYIGQTAKALNLRLNGHIAAEMNRKRAEARRAIID
jgi:hypothetical protein